MNRPIYRVETSSARAESPTPSDMGYTDVGSLKVPLQSVPFKPPPELKKCDFKFRSKSPELLIELMSRLERLTLDPKASSSSGHISVLKDGGCDVDQIKTILKEDFKDDVPQSSTSSSLPTSSLAVNKLRWGKIKDQPYYFRPSPIDAQFENKKVYDGVGFSGETISEWNLDGLTEYQIMIVLKRMMMYAEACRIKNNSEKHIAQALAFGFVGQLGLWWDNFLTTDQKEEIFNTTVEAGYNAQGQLITKVDAVNTLIYTIRLHFIGDTQTFMACTYHQLSNLKCRSMADFKYYKDTFFSKVYILSDCMGDYWKKKFVEGLPTLFSERVKTRLRNKNEGQIPWHEYTYGQLSSEIVAESLELCNILKLHKQLQNERTRGKQALGDFCEQYGYSTALTSSRRKHSKRVPYV